MSNSMLSLAVAAVIIFTVSGYTISYNIDIDEVVDTLFTNVLDYAYAIHGVLSLNAASSITDNDDNLKLAEVYDITAFEPNGRTYVAVTSYADSGVQILDVTNPLNITAMGSIDDDDDDTPGSWSLLDGILSMGTLQYAFAQTPDSTPPTFVSSGLDSTTRVLTITFSETIDVTPATNVVPTGIHIRESGSYTGGITLTAAELGTTADGTTISFTLTDAHHTTVAGLTTPELTIEPGAVRDTSGNFIDGTFDVSTLVHVDATSVSSQESSPKGMAFSSDGLKMFVIGTSGDDITEYTLSTAFDASTLTYVDETSVLAQELSPHSMAFSNDGLKMFVTGGTGDEINEYTLSTAFDASTLTHVDATSVSAQESFPTGMAFSNDGLKMFVVGSNGDEINEYTLSTAFDASTLTHVDATSVSGRDGLPHGIEFSNDGLKMFIIGGTNDSIYEYTLSTAFDASTLTYVDTTLISEQELSPKGMAFSNDGAKMFVIGDNGDEINEYTLSSVYPITVTTTINTPPVAEAGPPLQVNEGDSITLQGSGSDPDGNDSDLTYLWSQDPLISFDDLNSATPTVTAYSVTVDTEITLTLTVSDDTDFHTDTMVLTILNVTAGNIRPTVDVGSDQTVKEGATVSMSWTASDPDGDPLTSSWSQDLLSPAISLDSPNSSPTTFTAPQVEDDTAFTFTLEVTAGPHTVEDSLTITVKNNRPPTADIKAVGPVDEGVLVTLSGSASDPDKDPFTHEWEIVSGPQVTLTKDNTLRPQFTAPPVTSDEEIVFRLTVTDDAGEFDDDTVTITVRNVPITVSSVTYNPGSGTLLITFNQDIDTVDYSGLHVRSANSDTGGITLSSAVPEHTSPDRTITVVLDSDMRETYADLTSPQLVVEDGAVTDTDGDQTTNVPDQSIRDASSRKKSSSSPPAVHLSALIQTRTVDIPPHIAEQVALHDASDPLEPLMPDGTFDFPLAINGYGYLLDDATNTLVPQTVRIGDDSTTYITFTVYTQRDLAHFTMYLNLQEDDTNYADSDTYITYKDDGTTSVTDPHGYIGNNTTITVAQEDDSVPEKKTVRITIEFGEEPMGPTNMVAYMWDTDRKAVFIKVIDAFEVTAALPESVIQAADPEPATPDFEPVAADPEPVLADTPGPDDYDEAQALHIIRMWSGFESEMITDTQLLELLGLEGYQDVDLPDWMMTQLGVLVANGDVTVDEFLLALQYVLTHT